MLPIVGRWVRELLEQGCSQTVERWRWKYREKSAADINWRIGESVDLKDAKGARAVL